MFQPYYIALYSYIYNSYQLYKYNLYRVAHSHSGPIKKLHNNNLHYNIWKKIKPHTNQFTSTMYVTHIYDSIAKLNHVVWHNYVQHYIHCILITKFPNITEPGRKILCNKIPWYPVNQGSNCITDTERCFLSVTFSLPLPNHWTNKLCHTKLLYPTLSLYPMLQLLLHCIL